MLALTWLLCHTYLTAICKSGRSHLRRRVNIAHQFTRIYINYTRRCHSERTTVFSGSTTSMYSSHCNLFARAMGGKKTNISAPEPRHGTLRQSLAQIDNIPGDGRECLPLCVCLEGGTILSVTPLRLPSGLFKV